MSYAEYHARDWAEGKPAEVIRAEIARCEDKALHHHYQWNEVGCAHFDHVRIDTLNEILNAMPETAT